VLALPLLGVVRSIDSISTVVMLFVMSGIRFVTIVVETAPLNVFRSAFVGAVPVYAR
jgi:hypothetical protein